MTRTDPYANLRKPTMGTKPPTEPGPAPEILIAKSEQYAQLYALMLSHEQYSKRLYRAAFDFSNPVDEFQIIGQNASAVTLVADYGMTEIYESILFSLPLGCTGATLSIGSNRAIPLYSGPALTVQQPVTLMGLSIIAVADDRRELDLTGALTTNGYIGLMGHAFGREQMQ